MTHELEHEIQEVTDRNGVERTYVLVGRTIVGKVTRKPWKSNYEVSRRNGTDLDCRTISYYGRMDRAVEWILAGVR